MASSGFGVYEPEPSGSAAIECEPKMHTSVQCFCMGVFVCTCLGDTQVPLLRYLWRYCFASSDHHRKSTRFIKRSCFVNYSRKHNLATQSPHYRIFVWEQFFFFCFLKPWLLPTPASPCTCIILSVKLATMQPCTHIYGYHIYCQITFQLCTTHV